MPIVSVPPSPAPLPSPLAPLTSPPLRPWLPWLAFGLVLGALKPGAVAVVLPWAPGPVALAWLAGVPLAVAALAGLAPRWPWAARFLLVAAAALCGAALAATRAPQPGDEPRLVRVHGQVMAVWRQGMNQRFLLRPDVVELPAGGEVPRHLSVRAPPLPGIAPGDRVTAAGLWRAGVRSDALDATVLERDELRVDGPRGWAWRAIERVHAHRELAGTLLIGSGDAPERADFRQSGLLHMLSVSGLHLAIAAALAAWTLRLAGVPWLARMLALAGLVSGYLWLTGASAATQRATVMHLAVIAAGLLAREPHRLAAIALATAGLIALDPANANDRGFQLSVAAVAGIVTLGRDLMDWRARLWPLQPWPLDRPLWRAQLFAWRSAADGLAIGIAATLATAPLVAWYNGVANPWSPLVTLVASPPCTLVLWLGLPCLVLAGVFPDGPWEGLYAALEWNLAALAWVAERSAALPGASMAASAPGPWTLLLWPLVFAGPATWRWWCVRGAALVVALAMW